jgi:hypothetical protein
MHIAYFTNGDSFKRDVLRSREVSYRYPGSGWVSCLYEFASIRGINVASGDIALENVSRGIWSAKDILVVQDLDCTLAQSLLENSATPFMLTCFEAPLYAPFFYDKARSIAAKFKVRSGFGMGDGSHNAQVSDILGSFKFPSFYLNDLTSLDDGLSWGRRKRLALVAANKFKSSKMFFPNDSDLKYWLRQLKWLYWRCISPSYRSSLRVCLHESRLEAIEFFANHGCIDLYGAGWEVMAGLPVEWASRLQGNSGIIRRGICGDKLATLREYKFAICYENCALPGYITEKIIDCFVAGAIPIYRGAPDVSHHIPAKAYLSADDLSFDQLQCQMNGMDEAESRSIIQCGREYLNSTPGKLHSYEGFAEAVLDVALSC